MKKKIKRELAIAILTLRIYLIKIDGVLRWLYEIHVIADMNATSILFGKVKRVWRIGLPVLVKLIKLNPLKIKN